MTCAPSVLNPEGWTEVNQYVEPAAMGTALHEFCQRIVETGEYDLSEINAKFPDDAPRARMIVSNFFTVWNEAKNTITKPVCELHREVLLTETDALTVVLSGHIDLCQIDPDSAFILDYKTGRSHENHYDQIAGYAFLLWDYVGRPSAYSVQAAVVYLEDNTVQNYVFTAPQLQKWRDDVVTKVSDRQYVISRKCGYCRIAASCTAHKTDRAYTMSLLEGPEAQGGKVAWTQFTPEERGVLLDRLYVVKKGLERTEISLKSAMQGTISGPAVERMDIGNGMVYERVKTVRRRVHGTKALTVLRRRYDSSIIDGLVEFDLDALLDTAAKYAARGKKAEARQKLLEQLVEAGGVTLETQDRFQRRPADEQKLVVANTKS